ncbi:hypothetical protein CgunFtcFv8_024099 [Champsocephalus gunnari]|uniref:non-specific serine/threonine protein kinase n=1 Tax=Champsocephalus gunnari TaxID=52237 RepID=A0AAN8HLV4_CHAGU|nr:hypothetical protein CgunFtcFv8_024099 [Champsocephalus gunnari]
MRDLKETTDELEDSRKSSLRTLQVERISLTEEVRTYEMAVEVRESVVDKREIRRQNRDEVSSGHNRGQQVEEPEDEVGKPEDQVLNQTEERSSRSVPPTLKKTEHSPSGRENTTPPEVTRPTKQGVIPPDTGSTSQKELPSYKNTQQTPLVEADVVVVAVHYEDIEELQMEDLVKPKTSSPSKEVTAPKQPKEVAIPLEHDTPLVPTQTTASPPNKEVMITREMEEMCAGLEDAVPLEKPTPVSADASFEEELNPATGSRPARPPQKKEPPVPEEEALVFKTAASLAHTVFSPEVDSAQEVGSSPREGDEKAKKSKEQTLQTASPPEDRKPAAASAPAQKRAPPAVSRPEEKEASAPKAAPRAVSPPEEKKASAPKTPAAQVSPAAKTPSPPGVRASPPEDKGPVSAPGPTTVTALKQKGKIPVQETKTPESPTLKSRVLRGPKEKEPEVVKLKKVLVKPPEPEKQVVTHRAEVTKLQDVELVVHGLHERDDREIITLGRTERVFTAEEQTAQLGQFEEAERVTVKTTEQVGWTRTPTSQKEEEPEDPKVEKKKITKLPKADEKKDGTKLKPFEESGKPGEEPHRIQLKKVPTKPKEPEKEVVTQKCEVTRHYDSELSVQKLRHREDRELLTAVRPERVFTAAEDSPDSGHMEEPEERETEDEKSRWTRTPKAPEEEEPEPDVSKKKIKKLPKKDEEQEAVTLKPFEKPKKPEAPEAAKRTEGAEAKTDTERTPYQRVETPQIDHPAAAIKHSEDQPAHWSPDVPADVGKDQVMLKPFTKPKEKPEKASEALKQKGKIPVQETKTPESPTLKSRVLRGPKEKEPEVVKLKKVLVKPPEPEKQVVTHRAEVTKLQDVELVVHGLHERDDREIITLGRTERVFTAEEQTAQLGQFEEAERVTVKTTEQVGWTRTPTSQKEEEPEDPKVEKKKITKLPKADEKKDGTKLKPFEESGKPGEEPHRIQLKKVPTKPKEPEKEVVTQKCEVTRHYDSELSVQKLRHREDRELLTAVRPERVFTAAEDSPDSGHMEEPEERETEDEKSRWTRTPKAPEEEEPEPDVSKKKIKKLPKKDEEQEAVTLKPFEKPKKPEAPEAAKRTEGAEAKTDTERTPYQRVETPQIDHPAAAMKHSEDQPAHWSPDVPADVGKDQVMLKPFTKPKEKPEKKKPVDTKVPRLAGSEEAADRKASPPGKKATPQKQADILKTAVELKKTHSPRAGKDKVDEEKAAKPVEQLKKAELRKTPSPRVEKTMSPKDSVEAVTLKKTPRKTPPEEAPGRGRIPLGKEVSPGAVQMQKVPTQPEEEVFEEEAEGKEGEEEDEAWGWELVPPEDWEGEAVDGERQTPGMPGARRDGKPPEEAPKGRGRGLGAAQQSDCTLHTLYPNPVLCYFHVLPTGGSVSSSLPSVKSDMSKPEEEARPPPEDPFGGFKLKAVPLKFVKKIKDILLLEAESIGSAAVFECEVSPSTAITTWMKDGTNLREGPKHKFTADGKDRKLNIIDVQLSDTGDYTCVAKNAGKEITCTAKLVVEELPVKWVKDLDPETSCIKSQPMYLTCELNKEREVVWKRNGALLKKKAGKVAINIIGMQHAITIQNAMEEDSGSYTCEVEGQEDVKTTGIVKVIEVIKDWLVKPLRDQHVKPKAKATFKCELFKDTPNWKWFKGDTELVPSDKIQIDKDGKNVTLTVDNCQADDVSDYIIAVEDRRYSAKLTLGEREAEVLKPLASQEVVEKEEANFDTEISEQDVVGEWKLRGQVLMRSPTCDIKSEGKKRFMTLKQVQLDQAGEVSYQALNAVTTAMLTVTEIEMGFVEPLKDVSVPEKKQAKFECTVTKEVSKVLWFRGADIVTPSPKYEIMDDGRKHMLIINSCEFDDEAQYTVEVLGQRCSALLAVEGMRLKLVQQLKDRTAKEGQTVRFELELSHDNVPVVWYRNEVKLHVSRTVLTHVEGKRHILEMRTLCLDDTCQIKAEAKGVHSTAKLTVIEGDAVFVVKLQDYTATEKDEVSLDCELSKDVPVMWFHEETEVIASKTLLMKSEGTRRSLVLRKVEQSDKGKYVCDCGTDKTTASINIEARDIKVVRPIYGVELFDGETARFEVEISEDDVRGQWKLNGDVLTPSSDVDIIEEGGKHTLILYNCKVAMTGEVAYSAANAKCAANLKVKELPMNFLTPLSDVNVYEKDEARFELELSRAAKSFRWLKGTQELQKDEKYQMIQEGNMYVLQIRSVAYEDEAKYMFEAEDKRTSGKLVIQGIRLEFAKPIKDVTVKERETAEFSVELSHDKVPVVWYKNDVRLHPSKVVHMSDHGKVHTLAFKEVTIDDTSMIKVEAMDKSVTAMLTVIEGDLYFTTKLQNYTAVEKDEVKLICELSKTTADVKWFKDGKEITPSKNIAVSTDGKKRILMVRKAEKANIGEYSCDCGSDKTAANLNIEERDIKVTRPLYSVEVTETETAKFETEISEEDVHGNWKLKGEALHQSADVEMKEEGTKHLLILYNVKMDMAGGVDFSAANAKSNAQLRVKARSIGLLRPLKDVTVTAGETATFESELSYEGIAVDWFLCGKKMEASERVKTRVAGKVHTLTLRDVMQSEAGEVKMTSKDFQTAAQLIVRQPAVEFSRPLEDQSVEEEAAARLECEVSREEAEVRWFREGQEVRKTKKYDVISEGRKRALVILDCTPDDAKMYTCDAGDFKTSCFLEVMPPHVEFVKPLQDVEAKEKESARFECEVSRESAKVRWFKDGSEIRKGKKYEIVSKGVSRILVVHKSAFDDEAEYECDARTAKSCGMLTVIEEAARFTKNLSNVQGTETDSVKLICEVSKPSAEVRWFRGDEELPEGGRYEHIVDGKRRILIIQDLRMEDGGEYSCRLSATVTTSAKLSLSELAAEFIARPQNQEAVEGEKAEFSCSVSKDSYEVKWFRGEKEAKEGEKFSIVSEGKRRALIVKSCAVKDEGAYVAHIGGVKASAELTVIEKLRVITPIKDTQVKEGGEIVFNCETNTEGAKAKWLKNEETIFESSKYMMAQRDNVFSLRIREASKKDEAVYTISLTNQRAEQAKCSARAAVAGKQS